MGANAVMGESALLKWELLKLDWTQCPPPPSMAFNSLMS